MIKNINQKRIKSVAFVPARSGSKRIPGKNIRLLGKHPLIAYSIRSAIDSGVFDSVVCATDCQLYADIAKYYGAEVPFLRPSEISNDRSPDFEWVELYLSRLSDMDRNYEIFSILRPTSPFRRPKTIVRAWQKFISDCNADSLRAVRKTNQHPGKMWMIRSNRMHPLLPFLSNGTPWHSCQSAALPEVFIQDASLEISWTRNVFTHHTIAGEAILPFQSEGIEGFDINEAEDWVLAEHYLDKDPALLPIINLAPFNNLVY